MLKSEQAVCAGTQGHDRSTIVNLPALFFFEIVSKCFGHMPMDKENLLSAPLVSNPFLARFREPLLFWQEYHYSLCPS